MFKKLRKQEESPSFLQTSPLGHDLLEGQAQEHIATTIAQLIERGTTESKLIGLDGAWGSGKSNLIGIVESKLSASHHFFVYDSWGHQEDLHRRSFLEELTSDLCNSKLVNKRVWKKKLQELLSEKRETLKRTIPRLGDGMIATALVVIFTPIFQSIAEMVEGDCIRWFVTLIPLLMGVAYYGFKSGKRRRLLGLSEFLSLYNESELTNEIHETVYESQPSVRQFQRWMQRLGKALQENKRRLVIVFDNMDRLPPDKLRELWSLIHTFFAEDSFEGIWVIVPFDRNHMSMAFENNPKSRGTRLSEEFLRKTFSVIFRVPPPVMTDWRKFFEQKFDEAFKGEAEERLVVRKIFDQSGIEITPRGIIAFINEMVACQLTSQDKILLRHVATFVINRKNILKDPVGRILDGSLVGSGTSVLEVGKEFADSIAALSFGVPLASAAQVALHQEIRECIGIRDRERLLELSKYPGFTDVLEQVVRSEDVAVEEAIAALEFLEEAEVGTRREDHIRGIWDEICRRQISERVPEQRFTETHRSLLVRVSQEHRPALVRHLVRGFRQFPQESFSGIGYFCALSELDQFVHENYVPVDVFSEVRPHFVGASIFNELVRAAGADYWKFRVSCDAQEFLNYLNENNWEKLGSTSHLSELVGEFDFTTVLGNIEQKLTQGRLSAEEVAPLYELYEAVSPQRPLRLPETQHLAGLVSRVEKDSPSLPDLVAMRLVKWRELRNIVGVTAQLAGSRDTALAEKVARRVEHFANFGDLLLTGLSLKSPLMDEVLSCLVRSAHRHSISNLAEVLRNYDQLYERLTVEPMVLLLKLDGCSEPPIDGISRNNIAEFFEQALLFEHAGTVDCSMTSNLVELAREWFASLDVNSWRSVFADRHSHTFRVFCRLLESESIKRLSKDADVAYRETLVQFVEGSAEMDADEWRVIYRKSDKRRLKPIAKDVRDRLISSVDVTPQKFRTLSEILFEHGDLRSRSADVARRILAPVATDSECLETIVGNKDSIQIIKSAGDDASTLKDIIRQKSEEASASLELKRFAKTIGR